ncbi:MAG TPA: GNAT family N-acetyltransferase [Chitinophagaceae bacterium]|nr:GNAT family N-acetyltransferase [Chitinophagaceae bacterium]
MQTLRGIMDSITEKGYSVARLTKDNLEDIAKLHKEVYNRVPAPDYFPKKYNTAYTGIEYTGFIAYNHEMIPVAYYGVIPCFIQYGNEIILAAQSADTMTHPLHRYKGMFMELSNMTFALCRELRIRLIFGFPNQNFYKASADKWGWQTTDTLDYFTIPVSGFPLRAVLKKLSPGKLYTTNSAYSTENESVKAAGVSNSVLADGFAGIRRDDKYLTYKTYTDTKVVLINNAKVWIRDKDTWLIGDMEGINENNFGFVMERLKKMANRSVVGQIQFHCSPGTSLHKFFSKYYEPMKSFPVIFQDFGSPFPLEKIKFTLADIDIF